MDDCSSSSLFSRNWWIHLYHVTLWCIFSPLDSRLSHGTWFGQWALRGDQERLEKCMYCWDRVSYASVITILLLSSPSEFLNFTYIFMLFLKSYFHSKISTCFKKYFLFLCWDFLSFHSFQLAFPFTYWAQLYELL